MPRNEYLSYVQLPSEHSYETGEPPPWHPVDQSRVITQSAHPTGQLRSRDIARGIYPTYPLKTDQLSSRELPPPTPSLPGPPGPVGPTGAPGSPAFSITFTLDDDTSQTFPIPPLPSSLTRLEIYSTFSSNYNFYAFILAIQTTSTIALELTPRLNVQLTPFASTGGGLDPDGSLNLALDSPEQLRLSNRLGFTAVGLVRFPDLNG